MDISAVSTAELVRELSRREGVEKLTVGSYQDVQIEVEVEDDGSAVVLIVFD